jgi:hypothetical protein
MFLCHKNPQRETREEKRCDHCDYYQIVACPGLVTKNHERKHHHVGDDEETVAHVSDCKEEQFRSAE